MKPSELKKDARFSGRINKEVQKVLRQKGITVQAIIDGYIDNLLKVGIKVEWKHGKKE